MPSVKVHLDTDIGGDIDDLCALALLLNWPDVEITGITTVAEHDGKRAGYVRYALTLAGATHIEVAAGADVRLGNLTLGADLPPEEQYWPETVPACRGPLDAALDLLERSIQQGATIIGIGPYTNLSLLERRRPAALRNARIVLMGGCIYPARAGFPSWGLEDDYNVQADKAATVSVLESASVTLVPIEITAQTALRRAHLPSLANGGSLARLIARQAEAFALEYRNDELSRTYLGLPDDIINFQHDPLACAVALGWDGAVVRDVPLSVEMEAGWVHIVADTAGRQHRVVTAVDGERFNAEWLRAVAL
jgi:purine nucleosidase